MRRWMLVLVAVGAVAGAGIALAQGDSDQPGPGAAGPSSESNGQPLPSPQAALPSPQAALPRRPASLAAALTATTRRLRDELERWDPASAVPREVTYVALHHQRIMRLMATRRRLGDATLARLPAGVRGEARDTVLGRRYLAAIPRSPGRLPRIRVARAAPAAQLRRHYAEAQRRFGVPWSVLASVNFVESAFGRVRSASEAGARGPMQFLPATWRTYGMGGDIDAPRDAILAAANYLHQAGAPRHMDRALLAYNHSIAYVRAIRRFAERMRTDPRSFLTYYAWQVFARTPTGVRQLTGPGRD